MEARTAPPSPMPETSAAGDYALALEQVGYRYPNGLCAVDDLTLRFPRGSLTAVIGPSGSGKSTLLSLAAGLRQPASGTVRRPAAGPGNRPSRLTMVFQEDTLLPWRTVRDNVAVAGIFDRSRRDALRARAQELLEGLGLEKFADRLPHELSGGMRRRVAFLAGVAPEPEVILLDEPFSAVDEPTRVSIHHDVFRIIEQTRMTAVLVTHDLAEALTLADRVVVLTSRPARVAEIVEVPFGPGRDVRGLRHQPDFLDLYGHLWARLQAQTETSGRPR